MAVYVHPVSGRREVVGNPFWAVLFGGSLYFAIKGVWGHAVVSFVLAVITFGASWLVYPFFARGIMEAHYERNGWHRQGWGYRPPSGFRHRFPEAVPAGEPSNPWEGIG